MHNGQWVWNEFFWYMECFGLKGMLLCELFDTRTKYLFDCLGLMSFSSSIVEYKYLIKLYSCLSRYMMI